MTGFGNGVVEEVLRGNLKCIYEGEPSPLTYQVVEELEKNYEMDEWTIQNRVRFYW